MDFMGDFFGTDPADPAEREAEAQRLLKETDFEFVMQDGKVYLSADQMARTFEAVSRLLTIRALLTRDLRSVGSAEAMNVASAIMTDAQSEILRREASAILKADAGE